ncbi:gluconokinase [Streptomyces sp. ST2-7A]|uniref:gluconokinase n=1 Tax=Streptomyces sp. ST2-7A TaxID=2907214 RepID=UPI001F40A214|nr:gluconokinase [Streptomyces sp. ST2-7A]MCE7079044.1 gluconokinase [Streptomyces sp. ST2-7A]
MGTASERATDPGAGSGASVTAVVVMGVSGCGKSTIARMLADRLDLPMAEGDSFHSAGNVAKMSAGEPLDDADRMPWLRALRDWIAERAADGESSVMACSALRRSYRDVLREARGCRVRFVHMSVERDLLAERLGTRGGHFMTAALLDSQLETLEPPGPDEDAVTVPAGRECPERVMEAALSALALPAPGIAEPGIAEPN